MVISNADAVELHAAIQLTASIKLDRQATWNMAKNARIVKWIVSDIEEARFRLIKQFDSTGTGSISGTSKDWVPFITALQEVMNVRNEVSLLTIPHDKIPWDDVDAALTVDGNPVQTQVLKGAFSMMVEFPATAPAQASPRAPRFQ